LFVLAFFTGKSERADILDLGVSNDGLSFEIVKSKIKNLAAASLVGLLADPLLIIHYQMRPLTGNLHYKLYILHFFFTGLSTFDLAVSGKRWLRPILGTL
jgi:hypothetical protein